MLKQLIKKSIKPIVLTLVVSAICITSVVIIHQYFGVPYEILTSDVTAAAEVRPYYGFFSQLGILLWTASAALCLYTYVIMSNNSFKHFFLISGLITGYLVIDDVFLLHESFFPYFGISQHFIFSSYGIGILIYLFKYRAIILKTNFVILGLALSCFAGSMIIDVFLRDATAIIQKLLEEGLKFTGILFWLLYFFLEGKKQMSIR